MILQLLDSRNVEAFLAVCEEGTVGRAALRIHKTQPAITYNIQRLEETLGFRLFERTGRRLFLTPEGQRLRDLGAAYAAAFHLYRQQAGAPSDAASTLRIAAVSGFGRYVLYSRVRDLTRSMPGSVVFLFRTASDVFKMVEEGEVDCGAVYRTKVSNRLHFTPVYEEELVLITPRAIGRPQSAWRKLRTYVDVPFVTYEESDYVFGRWFETHFGKQPSSGIARWHVTELEEVIDAVEHGFGISIVPFDAVRGMGRRVTVRRPGAKRCTNQVFRVQRVGSVQPAVLDRVFAALPRR